MFANCFSPLLVREEKLRFLSPAGEIPKFKLRTRQEQGRTFQIKGEKRHRDIRGRG